MQAINDIENTSAQELALCIGVSDKRIYQLVEEGVLERNKKKKFDLTASIIKYIDFVKSGGGERARLYKAQADMKELDVAQKLGELLTIEVHEEIIKEIFSHVALSMDGAAGRMATKMASINDAGTARQTLLDENRRARLDIVEQIQRSAEKAGVAVNYKTVTDSGTPAKKKPNRVGKPKQSTTKRKRRARKV